MASYFFDSSALVKAYRREAGTPQVVAIIDTTSPLFVSRLAQLEVSAAIMRRGRQESVPDHDLRAVLDELDREIETIFNVIELSGAITEHAIRLTRLHALRAADALQLACAVEARRKVSNDELVLVSSDSELNAAALSEQITVQDPAVDEVH